MSSQASAFRNLLIRSSRSINEQGLERKQRADEPLLERYRSICPLIAASACTALSVCMVTWCALRLIVVRLESTKLYLATTAAPRRAYSAVVWVELRV